MNRIILVTFFMLQIFGIFYAKFSEGNYFGWVPFDEISLYQIQVTLNQEELSPVQISDRYNLPNPGRENRSIYHVFSQISQYERSYGKLDSAQVKVTYNTNGKEEEIWELQK